MKMSVFNDAPAFHAQFGSATGGKDVIRRSARSGVGLGKVSGLGKGVWHSYHL